MKPDLTRPVDFTTYNGTDKVCTRGGFPWYKFAEQVAKSAHRIGGYVEEPSSVLVSSWYGMGNYRNDKSNDEYDLFYALPEKIEKTFWIVVADTEISRRELGFSQMYTNRDEALLDCVPTDQIVPITLLVEE